MPRVKKSPQLQDQTSVRNISTEWFHGLNPEEQTQFTSAWRNSTYVLDRLKGIIQRQLVILDTDKEDDYNNPQWTVLRADRNGQLRMLRKIFNLLP